MYYIKVRLIEYRNAHCFKRYINILKLRPIKFTLPGQWYKIQSFDSISFIMPVSFISVIVEFIETFKKQTDPPYCGNGLSQSLIRCRCPSPHVLEHKLHAPHIPQPPSTIVKGNNDTWVNNFGNITRIRFEGWNIIQDLPGVGIDAKVDELDVVVDWAVVFAVNIN